MSLLKINWLLPIVFAIACGAFSYLCMYTEYAHLRVLNQNAALTSDAEKTWDLKLVPGKMYTIEIESKVDAYTLSNDEVERDAEENKEWTLWVVQNWKKVLITKAIKRKGPPFTPHTMVSEET